MAVNADNPAFEGAAPDPADDELSTTAPNPRVDETWRMPEPVFRKTSGRLPEGFVKGLENVTKERAARITGVEPGPPPTPAQSDPKPQNPALKLVLVILGIAGMIGFIAVFLTVVYFLFLR